MKEQNFNQQGQSNNATNLGYSKDSWSQIQKQAKQRWNDLKDSDLDRAEGSHDYLVSTVQHRCGLSRDQAEQQVSSFEQEKGIQSQGRFSSPDDSSSTR